MYDAQILQILGGLYLLVGLGFIFNKDFYNKVFKDMVESTSYMFWGGLVAYFLGALIVSFHNIWVGNWSVLVTVFGWLALIKGVLLMLSPSLMNKLFRWMINKDYLVSIGALVFVLGVLTTYIGFYLV